MNNEQTTRERLLDAAEKLIKRRGFDRTSVYDIMQEANVGKGVFYHHFQNKESLGLAVLQRDREEFMALIEHSLNSGDNPLQGIESFLAEALKRHQDRNFVGGCLWGNMALEMSDSNSVFADFATAVFDEWIDKMTVAIEEGQQGGFIRSDCSSRELAHLAVAAVEGGIMLSRLKKHETPMQECLRMIKRMLAEG